jgi:hypothetical protein
MLLIFGLELVTRRARIKASNAYKNPISIYPPINTDSGYFDLV